MKTTKEYFTELIEKETPAFVRVLEALPAENLDWQPDPKAATARQRASQIVMEFGQIANIFEKGEINFDPMAIPTYGSPAEMSASLNDSVEKAKSILQNMSDADWDSESRFLFKGVESWKDSKGQMALSYMLDLIHHRGQLSVYIRPMGGKVPSIYGPSADSTE